MKRAVISVLLICVMSCHTSLPSNYIELQSNYSDKKGYFLKDVKASTLFVRPLERNPKDTLMRVSLDTITHIYAYRSTAGYGLLGGLAGCAVGMGFAFAVTKPADRTDGFFGIIAEPFILLGAFIGCNAAEGLEEIDVGNPDILRSLKQRIE
jgi:hypothetical protein